MALKVEGPFFSQALGEMIRSYPENHTNSLLPTRLKALSRPLHLCSVQPRYRAGSLVEAM